MRHEVKERGEGRDCGGMSQTQQTNPIVFRCERQVRCKKNSASAYLPAVYFLTVAFYERKRTWFFERLHAPCGLPFRFLVLSLSSLCTLVVLIVGVCEDDATHRLHTHTHCACSVSPGCTTLARVSLSLPTWFSISPPLFFFTRPSSTLHVPPPIQSPICISLLHALHFPVFLIFSSSSSFCALHAFSDRRYPRREPDLSQGATQIPRAYHPSASESAMTMRLVFIPHPVFEFYQVHR